MLSRYDFYESAKITGYKSCVQDFLRYVDSSLDEWTVVKKSPLTWAAFNGDSAYVIPSYVQGFNAWDFLEF